MKNKTGFYSTVSPYLKKGTMVPIYSSEKLAVLRVADSFYIASDYTEGNKGYIAFLVNSKMVRAMMVDEGYLEQLLLSADRQTLASMMFELDRDTFRQFQKNWMKRAGSELQHSFVDEKMEQWIFDTHGKPEIQLPAPERKGIAALFKK